MVYTPEALEVRTARLLGRRESHGHKGSEHDVTGQARSGCEISLQKSFEALVVLSGKLSEIVPVS